MELEIVHDLDVFNQFVLNHKYANIMQSSYWGLVKNDDWKMHCLFIKDHSDVKASAMLLERKALFNKSLFYCPRGFVLDYEDENLLVEVIKLTKDYVKKNNGFALRFDPELPLLISDCRSLESLKDNKAIFEMISKYVNVNALNKDMDSSMQPRFQMLVNLKDKDLISKVKAKKRRLVKDEYLEKRGFRIVEDTSLNGVSEFARLSKITEVRQNISLRNEAYFKKIYEAFKKHDLIKIFFVEVNIDKLIMYNEEINDNSKEIERLISLKNDLGNIVYTNAILCLYGTNIVQMFYGASDDRFAKYKAGYRLHYYGMEDAQNLAYDYFNLGGVSGELNDGLFRFKSEFHPDLFEYMPDFDIVTNKLVYLFFKKGLKLAKRILRR